MAKTENDLLSDNSDNSNLSIENSTRSDPIPNLNNELLLEMDDLTREQLMKAKSNMESDLQKIKIANSRQVRVDGPIDQGRWLHNMGIKERMQMISESLSDKDADDLYSVYERLVLPEHSK